jgi:hypothetical protein
MSDAPWAPDRPLTHLGSGREFDAYLTADGWVFRFPRQAHCARLFEPEREVHRLVACASTTSVRGMSE